MPLKLNVGASRKVADNNFGSRGASDNLEIELDSSLVADSAKLQERIRQLFGLVRTSLTEELNGNPSRLDDRSAPTNLASSADGNGNGNGTSDLFFAMKLFAAEGGDRRHQDIVFERELKAALEQKLS